jgi:hypothetical protein
VFQRFGDGKSSLARLYEKAVLPVGSDERPRAEAAPGGAGKHGG